MGLMGRGMRWIFLSLLLANAIYFAFMWRQPEVVSANAVPVAVDEGRSLVLLEEKEVENHALSSMKSRAVEGQVKRSSDLCTLVGPFNELLRAEYFQEHLRSLGVVSQVKLLEVPGASSYWVYQSPQPSRKAALRRLQELQAKGLDSYVIPKGELENGISFGLYSVERGAQQRLTQIIDLGYEASIRKVDRTVEEIWVSMRAPETDRIGDELWFELLNREEGLEMRQNFCPAVASEQKFQ